MFYKRDANTNWKIARRAATATANVYNGLMYGRVYVCCSQVFRHGDRTPDVEEMELYPDDPNIANKFLPFGLKSLTNVSIKRMDPTPDSLANKSTFLHDN